ncbi:hypothetical protein OG320_00575 [Microbispora sp. NBC_01189]|nr:hypothetical protein OG320_00575 [Microbispora sp. NBC_01189]
MTTSSCPSAGGPAASTILGTSWAASTVVPSVKASLSMPGRSA